jgi:drug/metabolite transporter (DMT)-like permease
MRPSVPVAAAARVRQQLHRSGPLAPFGWRRRAEVAWEWREHRGLAAIAGTFGAIGHMLVLTAMVFTPVSYIAPARELSVVLGGFFGAKLLKETDAPRAAGGCGGHGRGHYCAGAGLKLDVK